MGIATVTLVQLLPPTNIRAVRAVPFGIKERTVNYSDVVKERHGTWGRLQPIKKRGLATLLVTFDVTVSDRHTHTDPIARPGP